MKTIDIADVTTNMVAGEDIYSNNKNLIIGMGSKFTDEIISDLLINGISQVVIETQDEIEHKYKKVFSKYNVTDLEELKEVVIEKQEEKFKKYISNPLMKKLYDASLKYIMDKYDLH